MDKREEIFNYVKMKYSTNPEKTFAKFPNYCILRHSVNNKWYGLIMNVERKKLGIDSNGETDVIDIKVETELIGSLLKKDGYYPAYNMNKENWISIDLSSNIIFEEIKEMIDNSYKLTS